jgi:hypothetical protein
MLLVLGCAVMLGGAMASSAAAVTVAWSSPSMVEGPPFGDPPFINGVSCPSIGFCVAVESDGVEVSDDPGGGAADWHFASLGSLVGMGGLDTVACASRHLCLALGPNGLVWSTHPDGGAGAWAAASMPPGLASVACPTRRLCVGVASVGVYATTDPQAGASAWREVSGQAGINDIACAGVHLCIAVGQRLDNSVFVLGTRTPLKAGRNWRVTAALGAEFNGAFSAASCPSVRLCVISDADGDVDTSTKPLSSARAWRQFRLAGMGRSVSCATPQLCVSVTDTDVVTSTRPGDGKRAWKVTNWATPTSGTPHVSCGGRQVCVVVDQGDNVRVATAPGAGAGSSAYTVTNLGQGFTSISSVACLSASDCLAAGADGRLLRSTDPTGGAAAWTLPGTATRLPPPGGVLDCPTTTFCGLTSGSQVWVADPSPAAPQWIPGPNIGGIGGPAPPVISCASAQLCAVGDGDGGLLTSTAPMSGAASWTETTLNPATDCGHYGCTYNPVSSISCPTTTFCAATDQTTFLVSTNPAGGASTWTRSPLPGNGGLVDCPDATTCIVVSSGAVQTTTDPTDPQPSWAATALPAESTPVPGFAPMSPRISDVSCASAQLCVAVDSEGGYAFAGSVGGPWTVAQPGISRADPFSGEPALTTVSCPTNTFCVAGDGAGDIITGQSTG